MYYLIQIEIGKTAMYFAILGYCPYLHFPSAVVLNTDVPYTHVIPFSHHLDWSYPQIKSSKAQRLRDR